MSPPLRKKQKRGKEQELHLLSFPNELLSFIFSRLSPRDIINLSLVNKKHRKCLLPFVFRSVTMCWEEIEKFTKAFNLRAPTVDYSTPSYNLSTTRLVSLVTSLSIIEANNKLEWHLFNHLDLIITKLSNINDLSIKISSASFCLKYFAFKDSIKSLTLETDKINSLFNLEHLNQFSSIENLTLKNFRFVNFKNGTNENEDYEDATSDFEKAHHEKLFHLPCITNLSLINCSWDYPFNLNQFVYKSPASLDHSLSSIILSYSEENSFLLSERFKHYLSNPIISPSLQSFTLDLKNNKDIVKYVNIETYLSIVKLRDLKSVSLLGIPFQDCDFFHSLFDGNDSISSFRISFSGFCFRDKNQKLQLEGKIASHLQDLAGTRHLRWRVFRSPEC
ncbi:hypothetical protein DASC09_030360 [Saccharomycopsis crataegensis]|uniref:F-box domain-containing protein n=1 Tax=Saccharomycopsis crataegensis TaxID=43959 RepID=A0AAV5QLY4_9ASCO|nr:hypothetical protein DASC09_030360 [Saccharomycopsis crataegensis]